jgi:hypothetical protein
MFDDLRLPTTGAHRCWAVGLIGSDDEDEDYEEDEERKAILDANIGLYIYPQKIPDAKAFDAFRYGVKAFFNPNSHALVDADTAVMIAPGAIIGVYFDSKEHRDAAIASARERWPEPAFKVDLIRDDQAGDR